MVKRQQAPQDFLVGHVGRVVGPAIGSGDGGVEVLVGLVEPGRADVVEVGQGAFLELGFLAGFGDRAERKAGGFFFRRAHPIDPRGRIQPGVAQFVEALRGAGAFGVFVGVPACNELFGGHGAEPAGIGAAILLE